ncbi:HAMP domain-containing sensor histidine kinase [Trichloromonas sp.]|uniref:sensor histidine kinase n=1 Tax=Trichloromonas sp. TaxID=3069249 RepID=UPI002A38B5AA|nr:ATP-binding protein [Trichloromonas sp.]
MRLRRLSQIGFRGKLLGLVALGIFALALTAAMTTAWVTSNRTQALLVAQGLQITGNLADQSLLALLYRSEENALRPLRAMLGFPDVRQAGIFDPQGSPLFVLGSGSGDGLIFAFPENPTGPLLARETSEEWLFMAPVFSGDPLAAEDAGAELFNPTALALGQEVLGYAGVRMSKQALHALQRHIFWSNISIACTFALGLLLLMNLGIKRMIRPLYRLSRIMEEAKKEGTHVYAQIRGPKEITHMAEAFNLMMSSLEERDRRLRNHREQLRTEVAIRTRELVEARDAALTANRHKSEFLANMSHELRTPLQAIIGYADLVREELEIEGRDTSVADLNRIVHNARRLLAQINNILDLAKVEAGRMELNLQPVRLHLVVEEALETVRPLMLQQGNRLESRLEGAAQELRIDREKLLQCLLNLLSNAGKFTRDGCVTLNARLDPALLRIDVIDTGIGISAEQQELIFEEFRQADGSLTRKFEGTGLGLAITRRFCKLMGGDVGLVSAPGSGSTFSLRIPLPISTPAPAFPPPREKDGQALLPFPGVTPVS